MHQALRTGDDIIGLVAIGEQCPPEVREQTPGNLRTARRGVIKEQDLLVCRSTRSHPHEVIARWPLATA